MDPDAALEEIRSLVRDLLGGMPMAPDASARLAELVDGLDGWIRKGGFLPSTWGTNRVTADTGAPGLTGLIVLKDGSVSCLAVDEAGYQQWGADSERLGRTVDLAGAIERTIREEGLES